MHLLSRFRNRKPGVWFNRFLDQMFRQPVKGYNGLSYLFQGKSGIEIGGPSNFFRDSGFLPIYKIAQNVDGCNFSEQTSWTGNLKEGKTYQYTTGKTGHQFICEGAEVAVIPKNNYDFVLSCNNLEHIANPLKAIDNWLKLLKDNGTIVLVLPRKESNFDHKRPVTPFEHLLDDYKNNTGEDDLTHLNEILQLHDLKLDPPAGNIERFKQRSLDNYSNRCLHHHVYDLTLLEQICKYFNLKVIKSTRLTIDHIIIAQKS